MRDDGTASGMCFLDFETPEDALRCLEQKHKKVFGAKYGTRYIQLEPVTRQQMEKAKLVKEQLQVPPLRCPLPFNLAATQGNKSVTDLLAF